MLLTTVTTISQGSTVVAILGTVLVIIGAIVAWAFYEKPEKKE